MKYLAMLLLIGNVYAEDACTIHEVVPIYLHPEMLKQKEYWAHCDIFPRTPDGFIDMEKMNERTELRMKMLQAQPNTCIAPEPEYKPMDTYGKFLVGFLILGFLFSFYSLLTSGKNGKKK